MHEGYKKHGANIDIGLYVTQAVSPCTHLRALRGVAARGLLRQPSFALASELQLLLQPRDLGVGGVEPALPLVQLVAGAILIGAQRLHPVLRRAQLRLVARKRLEHGHRHRTPDTHRLVVRDAGQVAAVGAERHLIDSGPTIEQHDDGARRVLGVSLPAGLGQRHGERDLADRR